MKRFTLTFLIFFLFADSVSAQYFFDDFESESLDDVGSQSDDWEAVWVTDGWTSALNSGGVSPKTDSVIQTDAFGAPPDAFDNAIIAGEETWQDYGVEADFFVFDDDGLGLVFRYTSADNYYVIVMSRDQMPDEDGAVVSLSGAETRLYRIANGNATALLAPPPTQAHQSNSTLRQRIRVEVAGSVIKAWIGFGDDEIDTTLSPLFSVTDDVPAAPKQGRAGLYAFAMGNTVVGTYFDSFRIEPIDSDSDGINNDAEIAATLDPFDADSDDDGIRDGDEFLWSEDTDNDGLINALDWDSDNDGLPDGLEQRVVTPTPDTNVAAGHYITDSDPRSGTDPLKADTDEGGVIDGAEDINRNGKYEGQLGETDPNNPGDDSELDTDSQTETDSETDSDSGTDADVDSDVDTDSDGDGDTETDSSSDTGEDSTVDAGLGSLFGGHDCHCKKVGGARSPSIVRILLF